MRQICFKIMFLHLFICLKNANASEIGQIAYFLTSCPDGWEQDLKSQGRSIVNVGTVIDENGNSKSYILGQTGGNIQKSLTTDELAKHTHYNPGISLINDSRFQGEGIRQSNNMFHSYGTIPAYEMANMTPAGKGTPFKILPPFIVYNACKKVRESTSEAKLKSDFEKLQKDNEEMKKNNEEMKKDNEIMKQDYEEMKKNYEEMKKNNEEMKNTIPQQSYSGETIENSINPRLALGGLIMGGISLLIQIVKYISSQVGKKNNKVGNDAQQQIINFIKNYQHLVVENIESVNYQQNILPTVQTPHYTKQVKS